MPRKILKITKNTKEGRRNVSRNDKKQFQKSSPTHLGYNPNMGWLFYKSPFVENKMIFNNDNVINLVNRNDGSAFKKLFDLNSQRLCSKKTFEDLNQNIYKGPYNFILKTSYPGLLTGSGYDHSIGVEEEFKLGFFFDWTTGLPIIQGSSVKGVLRYIFQSPEFLCEIIRSKKFDNPEIFTKLESQIFDGKNPHFNDKNSNSEEFIKIRNRDIFFDAFPINNDKGIFTDDFITPHKEDMLKNPTPLRFLKIKSDVKFCFSFHLHSTKIDGIDIDATEKLEIFKKIISTIGLGAKTNLGYGCFEE